MKRVTEKELADLLLRMECVKGMPMFANVLQCTAPKCTVKSRVTGEKNPYAKILKVSKVNILLNSQYEKAVINALKKEGKDAEEYDKGENTMPLVFGENNQFIGMYGGNFVLQYRPNPAQHPTTKFLADGKLTNKKKLVDYLPVERPATNQGLEEENEVLWRKLYLSNVMKITVCGETYKVIR